ncbi:MAG: hypothetical protein C4294_16645 [Nitrospiraceae bacterium]
MYAQVDRYEENLAVLVFDDEQQLVLPRESLPAAARPQGKIFCLSPGTCAISSGGGHGD